MKQYINNQTIEVWVQERVNDITVKNEKCYFFSHIKDVINFINGKKVKDKYGSIIQKKDIQEIGNIEMYTTFRIDKLKELDQNNDINMEELLELD